MKLFSLSVVLGFVSMTALTGCSEPTNEVQGSTNEIQDYLKNNPDAVEKPEDQAPSDESEMFQESMTVE